MVRMTLTNPQAALLAAATVYSSGRDDLDPMRDILNEYLEWLDDHSYDIDSQQRKDARAERQP